MRRYREDIADYDADLKGDPQHALSLYCRGIAELRSELKTKGEADIAAAIAINAGIPEDAKRMDVAP